MSAATPEPQGCEFGVCPGPAVGVFYFYRPDCLHSDSPTGSDPLGRTLWVCEPMRAALNAMNVAPKPSSCSVCGAVNRVHAFPVHCVDPRREVLARSLCERVDGRLDSPLVVTTGLRERVTCQSCLELLYS